MANSKTYRLTLDAELMERIDEFAERLHIHNRAAAVSILCSKGLYDLDREYGLDKYKAAWRISQDRIAEKRDDTAKTTDGYGYHSYRPAVHGFKAKTGDM